MAHAYSERVINRCTDKEWQKLEIEVQILFDFIKQLSLKERSVECLRSFKETMSKGLYHLWNFDPFFRHHLQDVERGVKPTKDELKAELRKTIDGLQIEKDSQTFAFRNQPFDRIYDMRFVQKGKFEFRWEDSPIGQPMQRGLLLYDLILPFNSKKALSGRCFETKELPRFYRFHF